MTWKCPFSVALGCKYLHPVGPCSSLPVSGCLSWRSRRQNRPSNAVSSTVSGHYTHGCNAQVLVHGTLAFACWGRGLGLGQCPMWRLACWPPHDASSARSHATCSRRVLAHPPSLGTSVAWRGAQIQSDCRLVWSLAGLSCRRSVSRTDSSAPLA